MLNTKFKLFFYGAAFLLVVSILSCVAKAEIPVLNERGYIVAMQNGSVFVCKGGLPDASLEPDWLPLVCQELGRDWRVCKGHRSGDLVCKEPE